jgi:hypothetical protein
MSDELTKEIDRLKAELTKATTDLDAAKAALKDTNHEARDRRLESKTLTEQLDALKAEREAEKAAKAKEAEALKGELDKTHAVLRGLKHEQAFARVAKGLKVSDAGKLADLYRLAEYKADGFEPDEGKIKTAFEGVLKARPWLLDERPEVAERSARSATGVANASEWARSDVKSRSGEKPPGSDRGNTTHATSSSAPNGNRTPGRL